VDRDKYKELLSTVAEWSHTHVPENVTRARLQGRMRALEKRRQEQQEQLQLESLDPLADPCEEQEEPEDSTVEMTIHENPTLPPLVTKIKYKSTQCDQCGMICEGSVHRQKRIYECADVKHWRERCMTCDRFQNPYTGKFDLPIMEAATVWNGYVRRKTNQ
jgi:hypothetical protein